MALDICRIGGLSAVGLLADKVLVELDRMRTSKSPEDIDANVFVRASEYLACAIEGLERVGTLEVTQNTVFAVDAYETVSKALPKPEPEDIEHITEVIAGMKAVCERLAGRQEVPSDQAENLASFFDRLSDLTTEERKFILQDSGERINGGLSNYVC